MPGHGDPREALIRRALQLQRVANAISAERNPVLEALFNEVAGLIAKIDPTGPPQPTYQRMRVQKLLDEVESLTGEAFTEWRTGVRSDLARLGRAHGQQITSDLVATLGPMGDAVKMAAPTQNMVKAILDRNPFEGETLAGWADVTETATVRRIRQQVQIGMMNEESIDQLVRRVRGGRGVQGVWQTTRRDAENVVRTAVTFTAAEAQKATYAANPRVVSGVQWVAALDSRTCIICGELDGTIYDPETPSESPPAHFSCRCALVPVIDWDRLGLEPPEDGMRAARTPDGKRTQVPASTSYEEWLKQQPPGVQDEVLGAKRGQLFRDGRVTLDKLVGSDNQILTLDELEAAA